MSLGFEVQFIVLGRTLIHFFVRGTYKPVRLTQSHNTLPDCYVKRMASIMDGNFSKRKMIFVFIITHIILLSSYDSRRVRSLVVLFLSLANLVQARPLQLWVSLKQYLFIYCNIYFILHCPIISAVKLSRKRLDLTRPSPRCRAAKCSRSR